MKQQLILGATAALLAVAGCTDTQRDSALSAVRDMQSSGVAYAAAPAGDGGSWELKQANEPGGGAAPPATPPAPGGGAAVPAGEEAADPIADFMESDPRDILVAKSDDLKGRKTEPWNEEKPETFIAETGRKDPLTFVRKAMPKELLPPRSGDDEENDLEVYVASTVATAIMAGMTQGMRCHSVIQIGAQKYAQLSMGPGQRFTVGEDQGFNQQTWVDGVVYNIGVNVVSIATDEVVVDVTVSAQGINASANKQLVFIPKM